MCLLRRWPYCTNGDGSLWCRAGSCQLHADDCTKENRPLWCTRLLFSAALPPHQSSPRFSARFGQLPLIGEAMRRGAVCSFGIVPPAAKAGFSEFFRTSVKGYRAPSARAFPSRLNDRIRRRVVTSCASFAYAGVRKLTRSAAPPFRKRSRFATNLFRVNGGLRRALTIKPLAA